jgi:hypothetical protein
MGSTLEDTTEETLAAIAKAQTTGILESTGAYSYDLTGIVRLIPVVTPFRDKVPRKASTDGSPFAIWRAFTNINNQQPSPFPQFDYPGNEVLFNEQDFQAPYRPVSLANVVTQDAFDAARGLFDPYAEGTMQTLNQLLIGEDKALIGAFGFSLAQPGTITVVNATTGGTIAASTTIEVAVAARTGMGYYYGGNSQGKATTPITTTGATSSLAASIAAVKGAVAYDWFFSSNSGATWFYAATTTVAAFTFLSTLVASAAVSNLPDISAALPTVNVAADNGSNPQVNGSSSQFNGFLASLAGDYNAAGQFVTPGTATPNPSVFVDGGAAALTLAGGSVAQIEALFASLWNAVKCSPTALMMNATQAQEIANLVLGSTASTTFLTTDEANRISTTAGGRVGQIVNTPAGGVTVPIEVHTSLPPGTIIARTDRVPFPQANISSTLEVRTLRDMTQFDYATNRIAATAGGGPRKEFEIRSVEAFINRAPVAMGALVNIS